MLQRVYASFARMCGKIPYSLTALVCRVAAAVPFWRSGQSKLEGGDILGVKYELFSLKASKIYLFSDVYGFPEAIAPFMAQMTALGENLLPPMLICGILTRFGALGLLVMTAVIQFYVFPEELVKPNGNWSLHLLWAAPLLVTLAHGPGKISVDSLMGGHHKTSV